jgi:predicted nicotinamide N-methyase
MDNDDWLIDNLNAQLTSFDDPLKGIQLYIPDASIVRELHLQHLKENTEARFPFWAKLWPSAIALAEYISELGPSFAGKTVLEIAGGLGLPSLAASCYAREVIFTDIEPSAVTLFSNLITLNHKTNLKAFTLDWSAFPEDLSADILLLSDVNYDDTSFKALHLLIRRFLFEGSQVFLSTPMRLIGRPFIEPLLPFVEDQQVKTIDYSGLSTMISILALRSPVI